LAREAAAVLDERAERPNRRRGTEPPPDRVRPLAGVVVVDFTRVLAGPTSARLLAELGATVVKVDVHPSKASYVYEEPLAHAYVNRGKYTACLDLPHDGSASWFVELIDRADVVVQNFTVGVAERLGIDEQTLRSTNPSVVFAYINCYGTAGPWAQRRGFEHLAQSATGMAERYGDGAPLLQAYSVNDFGTGILTAFAILLAVRDRIIRGTAQRVEASLVRTAQLHQVLYLNAYEGKQWNEPRGASRGWSAYQQLYRARDGWFFASMRPGQVPEVCRALGVTAPRQGLPDDEVGNVLETAFGALSVEACVTALRTAGSAGSGLTSVPDL
jgi:crotonobetainyl-CoA:carnitine CoA-transferase CaiB-like acyl-CoA transferase